MHQTIEHYFNNLSSQGAIAGIYEYVNQLESAVRSVPYYSGQEVDDIVNACANKAQAYAENESEPEEDQAIEAELASLLRGLPLASTR